MKPPDRIRQAAGDLERISRSWPGFTVALRDRTPDGYPTGGDRGPVAGISNPTPSVVIARTHWVDIWSEAEALTIQVQADSRRLYQLVTAIAVGTPIAPTRCEGLGLPGYDIWGDPTCERNAVKVGLCHPCYMRHYRWRNHVTEGEPPAQRTGT